MTFIHSISSWVPPWLIGVITMVVPTLIVLAVYRWFTRRLIRLAGRYSPFLQRLLARGQGPASVILVIVVCGVALAGVNFPWNVTAAIGRALLVAFVLAVGWAAAIALDIGVEIYLRRFRTDTEDNLLARKHVTQMRILQRVAKTLLWIITVAAALTTFEAVRQYGVSLFASAGAAGLVLGLAARPVLSNLLAGIQIAMTQPIRVEDQVVVEGETGSIETITSTYVVVRLWDLRRMVVPLSYFIEKPFQNWTYEAAAQIGAVLFRVGYAVSVESLRQRLEEIVRQSPLWDGRVARLEVTDVAIDAVELRALVSARNPSQTWDLRCEVREKLVAFLQAKQRQPSQPADEPPSRDVTTGDNRAAAPTKPRPDQRSSSPVTSDSGTR
ncbi:MAG: mechanosensitive ion channel family protein [Acetobacteraceae bacterium]|nr:mechanosensitive ion channel family protein [Acetobacteraceae bacterium]